MYLSYSGKGNTHTDSPMDDSAPEPDDIPQDIVILMETDQELQLHQPLEQVELKAQRVIESFSLYPSSSTEEDLVDIHSTLSDTTEASLNITPTVELLQALHETSSPTEMTVEDSQHPTALMNRTISTMETYASQQNMSSMPNVYNETDSHQTLNLTLQKSEPESTTGQPESSYETYTQNQTVTDRNPEENTQQPESSKDSQDIQETNLNVSRLQTSYSEADSNHTQEESSLKVNLMTLDPNVLVNQEEAAVEDPVQMLLSTQASQDEDEHMTQLAQTTESSIKDHTSLWTPLDGSGDISQGTLNIHLNF